jgi:hypothetical protein
MRYEIPAKIACTWTPDGTRKWQAIDNTEAHVGTKHHISDIGHWAEGCT